MYSLYNFFFHSKLTLAAKLSLPLFSIFVPVSVRLHVFFRLHFLQKTNRREKKTIIQNCMFFHSVFTLCFGFLCLKQFSLTLKQTTKLWITSLFKRKFLTSNRPFGDSCSFHINMWKIKKKTEATTTTTSKLCWITKYQFSEYDCRLKNCCDNVNYLC